MAGALAHGDAVAHNGVMSQIKAALQVLRKEMSQAEIAEAIGVNQSRISRWEKGDVSRGADAAVRLIELANRHAATKALQPEQAAKEVA